MNTLNQDKEKEFADWLASYDQRVTTWASRPPTNSLHIVLMLEDLYRSFGAELSGEQFIGLLSRLDGFRQRNIKRKSSPKTL
jgi:hypothetical protein